MSNDHLNLTQKELLIRIDERLKSVEKQVGQMQAKLISTSEHNQLMRSMTDHEKRINFLEDWRAGVVAQMAIIVAAVTTASTFLLSIIKEKLL